ncbi:hypothetical protein [Bradyrhizobium sp. dw_78]|uniref:hypothetical protein n=1 Tax=Bradyrhizobium sp. dw_78 TaxID=2719793 RepID=UPI001BD43B97|nr:hypothetical protein [Bradyrhizobium sp. dw_78]
MTDEDFSKRLNKKLRPELDQIFAEHERFMQLVAKMPEPTEDQKRAVGEANSSEGWARALDEVSKTTKKSQRKVPVWSVAVWLGLVLITCLILGSIRLMILN